MTLHMQIQATPGGSFSELDFRSPPLMDMKYIAADKHPAILTFTACAPQHTDPLGQRNFIQFWQDDANNSNSSPQTAANPLFEGFLWDVQPTSSNKVTYTAYDASHMASREVAAMSGPWQGPVYPGGYPQPGVGCVPRVVFNCFNTSDPDFVNSRNSGGSAVDIFGAIYDFPATIGNMLAMLLDDAILPLRYWNAAPLDDHAYIASELNRFVAKPRDKDIVESMQLGGALRFVSSYVPDFKRVWVPGSRKWRWYDPADSPTQMLTLNITGPSTPTNPVVLKMQLHRSLDRCATAVKFYGPQQTELNIFDTSDGGLYAYDSGTVLQTYEDAGGEHEVVAHRQWKVFDGTKQRGGHLLPQVVLMPMAWGFIDFTNPGTFQYVPTRSPFVEVSFDNGLSWTPILGAQFDFLNGIVDFGAGNSPSITFNQPPVSGSSQTIFVPNRVRLVWASFTTPLSVRYPATGFAGTAYDVNNVQTELALYLEELAVGVNLQGTPLTTQYREDQVLLMAQYEHSYRKNVVYTGGVVLDGLHYQFAHLNRNVCITALDKDGNSLLTGWESIYAIVTDCELDFHNRTTTLMFSSDRLEQIGVSVDQMKQRLGIVHLLQFRNQIVSGFVSPFSNSWLRVTNDWLFFDPMSGRLDHAKNNG